MIILIILTFIIIGILDFPKLIKSKKWKDLSVYTALFLTAFVMAFLLGIGVEIPSPIMAIENFMKDVLKLHY